MNFEDSDQVDAKLKKQRLFNILSNICFILAAVMFVAILFFGFTNNPLAFFALVALVIFAMLGLVFQMEKAPKLWYPKK